MMSERIDLLPREGNGYKANLHCHTVLSDGHLTPQEVKTAYWRLKQALWKKYM